MEGKEAQRGETTYPTSSGKWRSQRLNTVRPTGQAWLSSNQWAERFADIQETRTPRCLRVLEALTQGVGSRDWGMKAGEGPEVDLGEASVFLLGLALCSSAEGQYVSKEEESH